MNAAAQAMSPLAANVTIAPPRKIQISVGVRSTSAAACWNSSRAPAATSPASVVRRTAAGTRRHTVQATPALMHTPNTAASTSAGMPWNSASTPASSAPTPAHTARGST